MPRKSTAQKIPAYALHKASGQARCRILGKDHYLGKYGTEASRIAYAELLKQHASGTLDLPVSSSVQKCGITVAELCLIFMRHANQHYVKNGKITDEVGCIKSAIRPLVELYGATPVSEFGPLALKSVRKKMIEGGTMCRRFINQSLGRIRRIFRYAVENELVEPAVLQKLEAVTPLLAGRTEAKDHAPRHPVSQECIDMVRQTISPRICDLIDLQLVTGARPGELLMLTGEMIDRSSDVWMAQLTDHKTSHSGKKRILFFGPKSQKILLKYLNARKTRLFPIQRQTYGAAIKKACADLGLAKFTPHWLRHNAASRLREQYGLDVAQVMLRHASANITQLYAQLYFLKACEVARIAG